MGLLQFAFQFQTISCCNCGMPFAMSKDFYDRRVDDGKSWYCPAGHSQVFSESNVQKLQKELAKEKQRREWAESSRDAARKDVATAEHKARAYKGVVTKVRNRIGHGVCPCCTRSFQNLKRHMASKHPDFAKAEA